MDIIIKKNIMEFKTKSVKELIEQHLIGKLIEFYEFDKSTNQKGLDEIKYDNEKPYLSEIDEEKFMEGEQIIEYSEISDGEINLKITYKYRRIVDKIIAIKNVRNKWVAQTSKGYFVPFSSEDNFKLLIQL